MFKTDLFVPHPLDKLLCSRAAYIFGGEGLKEEKFVAYKAKGLGRATICALDTAKLALVVVVTGCAYLCVCVRVCVCCQACVGAHSFVAASLKIPLLLANFPCACLLVKLMYSQKGSLAGRQAGRQDILPTVGGWLAGAWRCSKSGKLCCMKPAP